MASQVAPMRPTEHERAEWSRLAADAYRTGRNAFGHRFSAAAGRSEMTWGEYDSLMTIYRRWLNWGWPEVEMPDSRSRSQNPRRRNPKAETFYVTVELEGEDVVIGHRDTFLAAAVLAKEELKRDPRSNAMIWSSTGKLLAVSKNGKLHSTRARELNPSRRSIHTAKWDRCVKDVREKGGAANPDAVCTAMLGERGSIKKSHRRNPNRKRRSNPTSNWIITARRSGGAELTFTGDKLTSAPSAEPVKFPTRDLAAKFARHLKRSYSGKLRRYRLAVEAA
jgi:hypothetical protein